MSENGLIAILNICGRRMRNEIYFGLAILQLTCQHPRTLSEEQSERDLYKYQYINEALVWIEIISKFNGHENVKIV